MDTGLIYDVGGYDGADTAHYLSLGYRVVCIEAAPHLAEQIAVRFRREIAEGQCKVLNVAVGVENGSAPFYLSSAALLNSFDRSLATRNGCQVSEITVPTRTFTSILAEHGVPHFLKIDIEGADDACLNVLDRDVPQYLSFEAGRDSLETILLLIQRGYSRFSLIRQDTFQSVSVPHPGTVAHVTWSARQALRLQLRAYPRLHKALTSGARVARGLQKARPHQARNSSGPTPMERQHGWLSAAEFIYVWTSVAHGGMIDSSVWYDIHAARDSA
jgi:FkbM family methyltransferase